MFRCQVCDAIVPAGTRSRRVVVKTRPKTYQPRGSRRSGGPMGFRNRRMRPTAPYDKGGEGTEIVQELTVCPKCAEEYEAAAAQPSLEE